MAVIKKSTGVNQTEKILGQLCDRVFLEAWNYPNPYRAKGKELCDLLAVFDGHIFIFQVKEIKFSDEKFDSNAAIQPAWARWKRKAFTKQLKSLEGAKNWILNYPDKIYLDAACTQRLPIEVSGDGYKIHKILVAHGAAEACKNFTDQNIVGSLGAIYGDSINAFPGETPFMLRIDKHDLVHVLDDHNLPIVLGELDTAFDFTQYLKAKELVIQKSTTTVHCGEEDMLACYFCRLPVFTEKYYRDMDKEKKIFQHFREGEWEKVRVRPEYKRKKADDKISYLWDRLLQRGCEFALEGNVTGTGNLFDGRSALYEMAKEPRVARRSLAKVLKDSLRTQKNSTGGKLQASLCGSYYKGTAYVFLWANRPSEMSEDVFRQGRKDLLEVACGAAKNWRPELTKIVGIAYQLTEKSNISLGEFSLLNCDFALLDCKKWTEEHKSRYEEMNKAIKFFETASEKLPAKTTRGFPRKGDMPRRGPGVNLLASKLRQFLSSVARFLRGWR